MPLALDRVQARRWSVPRFVRELAELHPELRDVVGWEEFTRVCARVGVRVRVLPLSRAARLMRYGSRPVIQINEALPRAKRAEQGMHELCHFFRDDPGECCYHSDGESDSRIEEFATIFAWATATPEGRASLTNTRRRHRHAEP